MWKQTFRISGLLFLLGTGLAGAATLSGVVTDEDGGPVEGAKVFPATAAVREGTSPLCPSCYPDCAKSGTTNAAGRFAIAEVDDALIFNVLVAAPGYRAAYARRSDPRMGDVKVTLSKAKAGSAALRGKVLDPEGRPVFGAQVEPNGYTEGDRSSFGGFPGDSMAVSDRDGNFELVCTNPKVDGIGVQIDAPQLARRVFASLPTGPTIHEFRLDRGVKIRGRLVRDGQGVSRANLTLVQIDRSSESFLGTQTIGTDLDGKFEFSNAPSCELWTLSACRDTLSEHGVTASVSITSMAPDSEITLPDLAVENGLAIEGQVRLADGKPIPPGTRVLISREADWDPQTRLLDAEGKFRFAARAGDAVTFHATVEGYTDRVRSDHGIARGPLLQVTPRTTYMDIVLEHRGTPPSQNAVTGVVLSPEGKPVVGAKVYLLCPNDRPLVENGEISPQWIQYRPAITDSRGRYAIADSPAESASLLTLLVLHEGGFAQVPFQQSASIPLTPWATIAGTARSGDAPLSGRTVRIFVPHLRSEEKGAAFFQESATTDAQGSFLLRRAIPESGRIGVVDGHNGFTESYLKQISVFPSAGKITRCDLGGTGLAIRGRIEIPKDVRDRTVLQDAWGRLQVWEDGSKPTRDATDPNTEKSASPPPEYGFHIASDGSFTIPDVSSGTYGLSVTFFEKATSDEILKATAGAYFATVVVSPGEKEFEIQNGEFRTVKPALSPGDKLPEFSVQSASGQSVSTVSLRRRPALIAFPCETVDASLIRAAAAAPAGQQLFTLLVNSTPGQIPAGPGWESLIEENAAAITEAFGVQIKPSYYVIARDGTIAAREHRPDTALEALRKVLAEKD